MNEGDVVECGRYVFCDGLDAAARSTGSHRYGYDSFLSSRGGFVMREAFCSSYKNLSCVTTLVHLIVWSRALIYAPFDADPQSNFY